MQTNPYKPQDRVEDTVDHFRRFGDVMFRQQRRIYEQLAERVEGKSVLEVGCGQGCGTAILERKTAQIMGSDVLDANVRFARCLYPWIPFATLDIIQPLSMRFPVIVAVEVLEHVPDARQAMQNLIRAATDELWISTPNGTGKKRPPDNPYHVVEHTPYEILDMLPKGAVVEILSWEDFEPLDPDTSVDPLVYRIIP